MHMGATVFIDGSLLEKACELSGIQDKTALVHAALRALIAREASLRLAGFADTSIWITHFRQSEPALAELPGNTTILIRPSVLGELACGKSFVPPELRGS
jgi:Arc/MetJ family transcription regulator